MTHATPYGIGRALRAVFVFALVVALHVGALYRAAVGMDSVPPAEVTQSTLSVALLKPPPPPPAAEPPKKAPGPRAVTAVPPPAAPEPPAAVPEPAAAPEPPAEPAPVPEPAPPDKPAAEPDQVPPPTEAEAPAPSLLESAQDLPTKGRIVYRTTYSRLRGITALTYVDWLVDVDRGRYELWLRTVDPAGLLELRSSGALRPFGIAPERYIERIEIANRELRAEFDWPTHIVRFSGRGAVEPAGFGEGVQDPLSLQFHVPLLAQAYPWRFVPGSEVSFAVARRGVEMYTFAIDGFEPVQVEGVDVHCLKLDRRTAPNATRRVELWLSPAHQWLPVRLRFTDNNGEVWDSVLTQLPGPPGSEPPPEPIRQEPVKP